MKCYLFVFTLLLISLVASAAFKNATTRKKGVESRANIFGKKRNTNNNAGKFRNVTLQRPVMKPRDITTTRGKSTISKSNVIDKRYRAAASNPKMTAKNSTLNRRFVTTDKSKNFAADRPTLEKRNIAVIKNNDTTSHTTTVEARNVSTARIEYKLLKKPHNLFIGRCYPKKYPVLHQENVIVTNDERSHVTAKIKMIVAEPVYITCANIYDQGDEGEESYPTYSSGGVGRNFIEFDVLTQYGKGFKVFVQIFGYRKDEVGGIEEQNEEKHSNNTDSDSAK